MTSNRGLNCHLTCLVYLPTLQNFKTINIINLATNYTYPKAMKLNVKL